jgi:hypothetical protein
MLLLLAPVLYPHTSDVMLPCVCTRALKVGPYLSRVTTDVTLIGNKFKKQIGVRTDVQILEACWY